MHLSLPTDAKDYLVTACCDDIANHDSFTDTADSPRAAFEVRHLADTALNHFLPDYAKDNLVTAHGDDLSHNDSSTANADSLRAACEDRHHDLGTLAADPSFIVQHSNDLCDYADESSSPAAAFGYMYTKDVRRGRFFAEVFRHSADRFRHFRGCIGMHGMACADDLIALIFDELDDYFDDDEEVTKWAEFMTAVSRTYLQPC